MLLDDETAPYVVGECLVHLPREQVEERLQTGAGEAWGQAGRVLSWFRLLTPVVRPALWVGRMWDGGRCLTQIFRAC